MVFVPDSCGIGSWEADFFVVKTWIKRGSYVVVVVVSLVIFGSSLAGLGGRRFQGRREKTADLLHSFQVVEQQLESMSRKVAALEKRAGELGAEVQRLETLRRELRAEIVPYVKGGALVRRADMQHFRLGEQP